MKRTSVLSSTFVFLLIFLGSGFAQEPTVADSPNMVFSIYGENLLVEDVYFPEFFQEDANTFPLRTGVAIHGSFTLKF